MNRIAFGGRIIEKKPQSVTAAFGIPYWEITKCE
jgi:hypothetical protein